MATLEAIRPRYGVSPAWQTFNADGEITATSRVPNADEAVQVLTKALGYLAGVDNKKSRLAALLGCNPRSVFEWMKGDHTPSARHLATLLDLTITQAESERDASAGVISFLQERIADLEARLGTPREAA